jgi:hypothetical protein
MIYTKFDWNWPAGSGEEDFKKISVFLLFCYYLPLEKGIPLHLKNLESPPPKDDVCQVWSKLVLTSGSGEEVENVKVYNFQTDDGYRAIRIAHLSFQLRWAKKNFYERKWAVFLQQKKNQLTASNTGNIICRGSVRMSL